MLFNRRFSNLFTTTFITALTALTSQAVLAGWTLDSDASSLYYVTSKAASVSEVNSLGGLSGGINDDGNAEVTISLGTVDTAIEIRNERMRDIVFEVASYPLASVSLMTDVSMLKSLAAGESMSMAYEATVDLHGATQVVTLDVLVSGLKEGGLLVTLARPLIIHAAAFGLADSVEQLREIAGLPSINNNVVVDFTLQFDAD